MDGKSYTVLSTVGYNEKGIYYYQNVFDGTLREAFATAKKMIDDKRYDRLREVMQNIKEGGWYLNPVSAGGMPIASIVNIVNLLMKIKKKLKTLIPSLSSKPKHQP